MLEEVILAAEERMEKTMKALHDNFASVRTGRANAMLLDKIYVDYYGVKTPITQMSAVRTPDAHLLVVEPGDKKMLTPIVKAIQESNLGITPSNDGSCIRLPFPQLTEERRKEYAKQARTFAEEARVAIRNARRDANTAIDKRGKEESVPEDEQKSLKAEVQKLTDKYIADIDAACKKKEADLMEV